MPPLVISQNDYSESRSLYLFFCILLIFSFLAFFLNFDGFARSSFIWYWFSTQFLLYKTLLVLQNSQQWSSPLLLDWSCGHCRCVILEKNKSWIFKFYLKSGNHQIEEFPCCLSAAKRGRWWSLRKLFSFLFLVYDAQKLDWVLL